MFQRLLVPLDGSEYAERALRYAADLARLSGAHIRLLSVLPRAGASDEAREQRCRKYLDEHAVELAREGSSNVTVDAQFGDPPGVISEVAQTDGADLVVMTTRGLGADNRNVVGSVALRVLMSAPCPVFMIRIEEIEPPRTPAEARWQYEGGANIS
jgi:nucleotide-binding universal stress UspA family protein